ncbi:hypothetical protein Hdeb2414_s0018g00523591 [Helianthus debilis subsp. tardiflorus]
MWGWIDFGFSHTLGLYSLSHSLKIYQTAIPLLRNPNRRFLSPDPFNRSCANRVCGSNNNNDNSAIFTLLNTHKFSILLNLTQITKDKLLTVAYEETLVEVPVGYALLEIVEVSDMKPSDMNDEKKRKLLLKRWALDWWDHIFNPLMRSMLTTEPRLVYILLSLKCIRSGYFSLLHLGFACSRLASVLLPPFFFICIVSWASFFSQFQKRKNSTLLVSSSLHWYHMAWRERCSYRSLLGAMSISLWR